MGFEGLSQPRHSGVAVRGNQRQKATALSSRQGLSAIGIAARSWADCQSFPHLSLASDQKGPSYSDSAVGGPASRHGQTHQLGSMKISSQLANNFGYCSTMFSTQTNPIVNSVAPATPGAAPPVRVRPAPILGRPALVDRTSAARYQG